MRSLLSDAFEHHVWATLRLLDACRSLTPEQLAAPVPGGYGPIIETLRHVVGSDRSYLSLLSGERLAPVDTDDMDLAGLRTVMAEDGDTWRWLLDQDLDPAAAISRRRDDGSESEAPLGIRLAQAVHHGTDHRSQVCTGLTLLGAEPPAIDVWDYADQAGRLAQRPAPPRTSP